MIPTTVLTASPCSAAEDVQAFPIPKPMFAFNEILTLHLVQDLAG